MVEKPKMIQAYIALEKTDVHNPLILKNNQRKWSEKMAEVPAGLEPATFCVYSRRDNHYTTGPFDGDGQIFLYKYLILFYYVVFHGVWVCVRILYDMMF